MRTWLCVGRRFGLRMRCRSLHLRVCALLENKKGGSYYKENFQPISGTKSLLSAVALWLDSEAAILSGRDAVA